nr:sugar transferase [Novosphingobium sp. ST904]
MAISDGIIVDVKAHGLRADLNDPAALARLGTLANNADRVVVACASDKRALWVAALRGANVPVEVVVDEVGELAPMGAGQFDGRTTLKVAAEPLSLDQRITKRGFDILFASAALVALLPLLLFTALAVRIDSAGPVMFRQPRIGRATAPS